MEPNDATAADYNLDPQLCRRARLSRDARFDGEFFLAVHTTGIYCRPICPARPAAEKNVSYFRSAARAARAGFRPCLRCRPESAPDSPAWNGTSTTVQRALQLIRRGALNDGNLPQLAERLGIGERYLRKLFGRELGVSPQAVALNQRLLFARKLLMETRLPVTQVAFAAGFGSVRRFNGAMREQLQTSPSELRKRSRRTARTALIELQLQYRPPFDWEMMADFFRRHAIEGVERVGDSYYERNLLADGSPGRFRVEPQPGRDALKLRVEIADNSQLMPLLARVRRMFDLDANPQAIAAVLGRDPLLVPAIAEAPGLRCPGYGSLYEASVRGVVGQQVSTRAARAVLAHLAQATAREHVPVFPGAQSLAELPDTCFRMPGRRRDTLRALCALALSRSDSLDLETLAALRGVGPWTVAMVSMRGAGHPDILPMGDLGLDKAWAALAGEGVAMRDHAEQWRPWRSYAANMLWRRLSP